MEMRGHNAPKSLALGTMVDMDGAKSRDITLMSHMGKKQQLNVRRNSASTRQVMAEADTTW